MSMYCPENLVTLKITMISMTRWVSHIQILYMQISSRKKYFTITCTFLETCLTNKIIHALSDRKSIYSALMLPKYANGSHTWDFWADLCCHVSIFPKNLKLIFTVTSCVVNTRCLQSNSHLMSTRQGMKNVKRGIDFMGVVLLLS